MNQPLLAPAGPSAAKAPDDFSHTPIGRKRIEKGNEGEDFFGLISKTQAKSGDASGADKTDKTGDSLQPASDPQAQGQPQPMAVSDQVVTSVLLALLVQPQVAGEVPKQVGNGTDGTGGTDEGTVVVGALGQKKEEGETSNIEHRTSNAEVLPRGYRTSNIEGKGERIDGDLGQKKAENAEKSGKGGVEGKGGKRESAEIAGGVKVVDEGEKSPGKDAEHIKAHSLANNIEVAEKGVSGGGMSVALNGQRMKFAANKNEIAGAVQKVPHGDRPLTPALSPDGGEGEKRSAVGNSVNGDASHSNNPDSGSTKENSNASVAPVETNVKITVVDVAPSKGVDKAQVADRSAAQVERLAQMVNREVTMVRQSGATALAVSLKVDAHTELFLQLTNHDGQMQALLRCERGDAAGLGRHWNDLQESLAKQNVHLMPLENRGAIAPVAAATSSANTSSNFNQPSQNSGRQAPEPREEIVPQMPESRANGGTKNKTKNPSRSRQGWESWA